MQKTFSLLFFLFVSFLALSLIECEDDNQVNGGRERVPAEGFGSLLFENASTHDWNLQINGENLGRVVEGTFSARDLPEGDYMIHLDQHLGSEVKDITVPVQLGKVTVMRMTGNPSDFDLGLYDLDDL